jgi:hypothetical protein
MILPVASGDWRLAIMCRGAILLVGFLLGAGAEMTDRPPGILRFLQSCRDERRRPTPYFPAPSDGRCGKR